MNYPQTKDLWVFSPSFYKIGLAAMLEPVKIPQRLQRAETLK